MYMHVCRSTAADYAVLFDPQVFVFQVSSSDSIELELRDYFVGNSPTQSHFLGKTELFIQDFLTFDLTW